MVSLCKIAVILAILAPSVVSAATTDLAQRRQAEIDRILASADLKQAIAIRTNCASGIRKRVTEQGRNAGLIEIPDVADACVTALTRIGRSGKLGYVRDTRSTATTPAIAFDNGFVAAYLKRDPTPAGVPTMSELKSTAERCLDQREDDADLCQAIGYAYGVRAANGEVVRVL